MKKYKIKPIDFLNNKGLNTLTLQGSLPLFDAGDINVYATLSKEEETAIEAPPYPTAIPNFGASGHLSSNVVLKRSDLKDFSDETILAAVIKELKVELVETKPLVKAESKPAEVKK